ncbi:NADP-dependent oxidoreductase domain-containing protein, partial [Jimgerdemannia flammicorona]
MSSQAVTPSLTLSRTGDKMPIVGFGCWKVSKDVTEHTVECAIREGYRLFDSACDYGNEVEVGRGIANAIKAGVVKREELFVTTKLWNTYHKKEHVRAAFDRQLKDLGLDYFDLYLVHFPVPLQYVPMETKYPPEWFPPGESKTKLEKAPLHELWPEMEKLVHEGLVKNIGISNFNVQL